MKTRALLFACIALFYYPLFSQEAKYPPNYFISPLDFDLYLSGTFGELRTNHLHAGIDIKTGGGIGKKVYAVADGYVSRIKVSPGGYGKVLYITHPNGFVSVYGHLDHFNDTIGQYVKKTQYQRESFSVELYPGKDQFRVKKGELIAYSGNSGGSSAPHLHFELREESSQHPVNPLLFESIKIKDTKKPVIQEFGIYPVEKTSLINGKNDTVFYSLSANGGSYTLAGNPRPQVSGKVSFGIRAYDPMDEIPNQNGIYSVNASIDGNVYYGLEMDKISFATSRYINSLIDYNYFTNMQRRLIRTQIDTNNQLFNYRDVESNGIAFFNDSLMHTIRFDVADVYGNTSKLVVDLQSVPPRDNFLADFEEPLNDKTHYLNFRKDASFSLEGISVSFPANCFYQSFNFSLDAFEYDSSNYSRVYQVHNRFTPVEKSYTLSIRPEKIEPGKKDKMFIAIVKGKSKWYIGSGWVGDRISTTSRLLGNYTVSIDTLAPAISPVNISDNKNIRSQKTIKMKISDKETGINHFRGTLNGDWILMDYDSKENLLMYEFDDKLKNGSNKFKLVVTDMLENEAVYEATLLY